MTAIVVIIVVIAGAAGAYYFLAPPASVTIVIGTTDSVEAALDMALAYDYFGWELITCLSAGLVDIRPGSQAGASDIIPALATDWIMSGEGKIWDFELRTGVTYDGVRPFNATCVKYTFDRNCNLTGVGLYEPDGPQLNMDYQGIIKNVTILETYKVRFNLKIAFAPFLQLLACAASYIVDPVRAPMKQVIMYNGTNLAGSTSCGLGPYVLEKWDRSGTIDKEVWLKKNPYYWNVTGGIPKNTEIIIKKYTDATSLATAMAALEIDIAYRQLLPEQVQAFENNTSVKVWKGIGAQIQYMCFQQRIYPFNETDVRIAVAACLNRTNICSTVFRGTADPLYSIIPNGMAYHKSSFAKYGTANYTYAASLLAPFGYNATNHLVIDFWYESSGHYPSSAQQALVYESDFEESNVIDVNLHGVDWGTYKGLRDNGTMPVFVYGWYPDFVDPDNYGFLPFAAWLNMDYDSTHPQGGIDMNKYWTDARSATTSAGRLGNYTALQDLQASECSVVPLWQKSTEAVTKLDIKGIVFDITVNWRNWLLYRG
ncbi:MAG: hypothetical protein C4K47_01800 [Candidatus Thorarchaeota archaeon]|nr:MAG: hypothetical protein C4K47_01800 [Candidatus Thorarchaeota archaeon]